MDGTWPRPKCGAEPDAGSHVGCREPVTWAMATVLHDLHKQEVGITN